MTAKSRKRAPMKVSQMRERLRELSGQYEELRRAVRAYQEVNPNTTLRDIGEVVGYGWGKLEAFMDHEATFMGGKTLLHLGDLLGCESLVQKIVELTGSMREGVVGLALESDEVIELALGLQDAWRKQKYGLTQEQFAEAFEPYAPIVTATLRVNKEDGYGRLRDTENRERIRELLKVKLDDRLQGVAATHRALKQEVVDSINQMLRPYVTRYGSVSKTAEIWGYKRHLLTEAVNGSASIEQTQKVRSMVAAKINELIELEPETLTAGKVSGAEITQEAKTVPDEGAHVLPVGFTPVPFAYTQDLLPAPLASYAGETVGGQPFVLTAAAVREVETREVLDFVETLQRMMARTRAMINVASQMRDEHVVDIVRERLNHEVVEMYRSLKIFTSTHPNELTEIYDSERQIKSVQRATHGTMKGKGA